MRCVGGILPGGHLLHIGSFLGRFPTLKKEMIHSSEVPAAMKTTLRYIPEVDSILSELIALDTL
jgi:hypothetical protein